MIRGAEIKSVLFDKEQDRTLLPLHRHKLLYKCCFFWK